MKNILECVWCAVYVLWTLLTSKEERRQFMYDLGNGEIEE